MEYHSALKTNELTSYEKTWKNLKCILLGERSQSENAPDCIIQTMWHSEKGNTMGVVKIKKAIIWNKKKIWGCQRGGEGENGE